jgi:hypothetical protein
VVADIELFSSTDLTALDICLWVWMSSKVDKGDELLDAAGCIKKGEDQLRRTTRDLRTRVAKYTEVETVRLWSIYCDL